MLKELNKSWIPGALYGVLLVLVVLCTLLFSGATNLTGQARQDLALANTLLNAVILAVGVFCALFMALRSIPRALLAGLLLVLRWIGPATVQSGIVLDTVLLAVLSGLGNARNNGLAWLASHVLYVLLLFVLMRAGWAQEALVQGTKAFWIFQVGHSYGMGHPNSIAILFLTTWLMIWVLFLPRRWWVTPLIMWGGAFIVYAMTLCRTVAVLMIIFPILYIPMDALGRSKRAGVLRGLSPLPFLMMAVTVVLGLMSNTLRQYFPDGAFWARFTDFEQLRADGLSLFGAAPSAFRYFDNLYLWLLMFSGRIPTIGVLAMYAYMLYKLARERRIKLLAVAVVFLAYGLMENAAVYSMYFFVPMLAFAQPELPDSRDKEPAAEVS